MGLSVAAVGACTLGENIELAEAQVAEFHKNLSEGRVEVIYDLAADEFKKSGSRDEALQFLRAVRSKLGAVKESKKQTWDVNYHTVGTFVSLVYETEFIEGKGTEYFVYRIDERAAKLVSYKIDSMALVVK